MNVNTVYEIILLALQKNAEQGYVSPDDFNNRLMPQAQAMYLDFLLGEYQKYQPTRPFPSVSFSGNERVRESMAALIYNTVLSVDATTGISPFPSDFEYTDAMWTLYGFYRIRFTQQDRLWSTFRSVIDPVTETDPIYMLRQEGFQFLPATIGNARMSYVRKPPPIIWGYTLDGNGLPVYNPLTSQQPVWSDSDMMQIIVRALAIEGVALQLPLVMQYSQEVKQNGQ